MKPSGSACPPPHLRRVEEAHGGAAGLLVQHRYRVVGQRDHLRVQQLGAQALEARVADLAALVGVDLDARRVVQQQEVPLSLCGWACVLE